MEKALSELERWASHGTLRQFYLELEARLAGKGYVLELEGDTLTVYAIKRKGGFWGIGKKEVKLPCLQLVRKDNAIKIPAETADPAFVALLLEKLYSP